MTLLNDPTYVEAARVFASRIIAEGGSSREGRIVWAFRQAVARAQSPDETALLSDMYAWHLEQFRADPDAANRLLGVASLNRLRDEVVDDPEIATRISQYEMAFRMQTSVPDLMDLSDEPRHVLDLYGVDAIDGSFAANCLLARRMAERGVRFIQLYHRGWDHHEAVQEGMETAAGLVDRASAALVLDLKQRGMLEDTLVVWGGEFGRTPMAQGTGRDHHIRAFSMWMAGGGIGPGFTYGRTDEFGYNVVENPVHVHDLHATLLSLLGIDHERLTYRFQGRDFRLTDVEGRVVHPIVA